VQSRKLREKIASLLGLLENEKLGTKDLKRGFGGGLLLLYLYLF
jgi:hypothetical protein